MKNVKNFFKIFSIQDIIQLMLIILCIFILLDIFNIPTLIIVSYNVLGIILISTIVIFIILKNDIINLIKLNVFNYVDLFFVSFFLIAAVYIVITKLTNYSNFKFYTNIILCLVTSILIILRLYICKEKKVKEDNNINIYDIKNLYENKLKDNNELIFLEEKDVGYDLLNRNKIINDLYNSINFCKNKQKFTISLTGTWGSGKTTILNIVKQRLDPNKFIVVDSFDIWKYNNEKALLFGVVDEILKKLNINFSTIQIKKVVNSCICLLTAKTDINIDFISSDQKALEKIKLTLEEYLEKNDKRVVFIIDNFERTNESNILIILKTISSILNINRFIYILSYDADEMKDIFKNKLKINYDYMEKVIQLPLAIPSINKKDIDLICTQCLENLLEHYGLKKEEIRQYIPAINLFNKNIKDLRSFKRKINSICNSCFYSDNVLNKIDSFLISLIEQENFDLYCDIEKNYNFYISFDQIEIYGYQNYDAKLFNEKATEYFDQLFKNKENEKYKDILALLFPNVKKYINAYKINGKHVEFWSESTYFYSNDKSEYNKSIIEKKIYNAKFFDLYFTKQKNDFINIDSTINDFIKWNNEKEYEIKEENIKKVCDKLKKVIFLYTGPEQKYILEDLEIYTTAIKNNNFIILLNLIGMQEYIDNSMIFLRLNAKKRLEIVCANIIKQLSDDEIILLKEFIEKDYKDMYLFKGILYWLRQKNNYNDIDNNKENLIYNTINESYEKLIKNVSKENINIYDKANYSRYNIYCLIGNDEYKNQIHNIDENTIFRFLADMITDSIGTSYGYSINLEEIKKITSYEFVDDVLKKIDKTKMTKLEQFIYEIYNKSKEETSNIMLNEKSVYREEYIDVGKIAIQDTLNV